MFFIEKNHTYLNNNKIPYKSVTSVLKDLEPKKDWDKIAEAYAKKNNLTKKEVLDMWQKEKDNSITKGKKYHASEEARILSLPFAIVFSNNDTEVFRVPTIKPTVVDGVKISESLKLSDGVYPELMLWLDSAKVAGQADRVEILNGKINIIDYKTNKKINTKGFTNRFGVCEKLLSPCGHLDNCNFNIYSLQLNFYAFIIKKHNPSLKIGEMIIKHIEFDELDQVKNIVDMKVPNLQKEIKSIVDKLTKPKTFNFK